MQKFSIIYVDNDPKARNFTVRFLLAQEFTVWSAANHVQALKIITHHHINIALIDMRLIDDSDPYDKSGLQLAELLRQQNMVKIIIMVTNDEDPENIVKVLRSPGIADDYVAKRKGFGYLLASIFRQLADVDLPALNGVASNKLLQGDLDFTLYEAIRNLLLQCPYFKSYNDLTAVFIDSRLSAWQYVVPYAEDTDQLVRLTISRFLRLPTPEKNGLLLLLEVLTDHISYNPFAQQQFIEITERLRRSA